MTDQRQRTGLEALFEDIEDARRERPAWRRWLRRGALLLLGLLVLAFLLSIPSAIGAASGLLDARADLMTGREALISGDVTSAERAFGRARESFAGARGDMGNPAVRVISWLPLLGRTPDAVTSVAEAGELVAQAGLELARSGEGLPGQVSALAPSDGRIPLEPMRQLAPGLDRAADLLGQADAIMSDSPGRWIPGPVGDPRYEFAYQVSEAHRIVDGAAELARTLPAFLGGEGRKRYFVAAQNPAELRGTGGFIGAYSIMTIADGRVHLGTFRSIIGLTPARVEDVEPPNRDYDLLYDPWGGAGLMHSANMTPDFPSAAVAIERLYEEVEGQPLDGVIAADPEALALLMGVTGSAEVPGLGVTLNSGNLVPFVTNEGYGRFEDNHTRKRLLGDVADLAITRFLNRSARDDPVTAGRAVAQAAAGGHLLLHSTDPRVQAAFERARVAGEVAELGGDYLNVVVNNIGVNKIDYFVDRTVRYEVELLPDGAAEGVARVRFDNEAPSSGEPDYVIGTPDEISARGESVQLIAVYCARSCTVQDFRRDGRREQLSPAAELGHPMGRAISWVERGGTEELQWGWQLQRVWEGTTGYGTYRLVFQGQPTIRPTQLEVVVRAPDGMAITRTNPEMEVNGDTATWRGTPGDLQPIEVEFARPLPARIWHAVLDFLNQPLF